MTQAIKKTAVMSLALMVLGICTITTASAQRGAKNQKTKKGVTIRNHAPRGGQGRTAPYQRGSKHQVYKGRNHRGNHGHRYGRAPRRYVQAAPPRYHNHLPPGCVRVRRHGHTYYRHNNTYYQGYRNNVGRMVFKIVLF